MADCDRLSACPFFKGLRHLPRTADQLVVKYCKGDNTDCARLWVSSSGVVPPEDLFPNETDRALVILAKAGRPRPADAVPTNAPIISTIRTRRI
jgi:hypothetical protein